MIRSTQISSLLGFLRFRRSTTRRHPSACAVLLQYNCVDICHEVARMTEGNSFSTGGTNVCYHFDCSRGDARSLRHLLCYIYRTWTIPVVEVCAFFPTHLQHLAVVIKTALCTPVSSLARSVHARCQFGVHGAALLSLVVPENRKSVRACRNGDLHLLSLGEHYSLERAQTL
jgi:hypothetical protein